MLGGVSSLPLGQEPSGSWERVEAGARTGTREAPDGMKDMGVSA